MKRSNSIVKLGRFLQLVSPIFSFLDIPSSLFKTKKDPKLIIILAPPRSGSTLTYQVLSQGLKTHKLSNILNLLYSIPIIGLIVSKNLCKKHKSKFKSNFGFVNGFCGESEGLKFWNYWGGCSIIEKNKIKRKRLFKLKAKLKYCSNIPFISCFLGHVYSIDHILEVFGPSNVLFVHLKRNIEDNSRSLRKYRTESGSTSSLPKNIDSTQTLDLQVRQQIIEIHKRIDLHKSERNYFFDIKFQDLCDNPKHIVEKLLSFSKDSNFLFEKNLFFDEIPSNFQKVNKHK